MNKKELPSLLLLPGLLCNERLWQNQVNNLVDICQPFVADFSQDDSIEAMARRVLDRAPEQFFLAGLSMGGYVAFEIMRQAPERVTRLALFDTMARLDEPERAATRKGLLRLAEEGRFIGVTPRLLPNLIHKDKLNTPVADEVMKMAAELGKEVFLKQQTAILNRSDSIPTLSKIKQPTIIVVGEDDKLTPPEESVNMAKAIPNAQLHRIPKCGHLPPLEYPQLTTELLRDWILQEA
ncbi:alpha/beta hydrolase [Entomomonas sp. E2T0]|nr:alpha/beta hydrolase [Entomomonas sp. E2T0]